MVVCGFGALCGFASGIASRYYYIRPELTRGGLKTLAQGGFIGAALQVAAIAVTINAARFFSNTSERKQRLQFVYVTTLIGGISVLPPLYAIKLHRALPYKEVIATAALSSALFCALVPSMKIKLFLLRI